MFKDHKQEGNESSDRARTLNNTLMGPALQDHDTADVEKNDNDDLDPALSPYSQERQQVRLLTMPPVANFNIPPSPGPGDDADLAVSRKKIAKFVELKHKGVHYNEKLVSSSAFKNPAMTDKLLAFAGIQGLDQYRSSLPEGTGVDVDYWASLRVEEVVSRIEARREADAARPKGSKRDFVSAGQWER